MPITCSGTPRRNQDHRKVLLMPLMSLNYPFSSFWFLFASFFEASRLFLQECRIRLWSNFTQAFLQWLPGMIPRTSRTDMRAVAPSLRLKLPGKLPAQLLVNLNGFPLWHAAKSYRWVFHFDFVCHHANTLIEGFHHWEPQRLAEFPQQQPREVNSDVHNLTSHWQYLFDNHTMNSHQGAEVVVWIVIGSPGVVPCRHNCSLHARKVMTVLPYCHSIIHLKFVYPLFCQSPCAADSFSIL